MGASRTPKETSAHSRHMWSAGRRVPGPAPPPSAGRHAGNSAGDGSEGPLWRYVTRSSRASRLLPLADWGSTGGGTRPPALPPSAPGANRLHSAHQGDPQKHPLPSQSRAGARPLSDPALGWQRGPGPQAGLPTAPSCTNGLSSRSPAARASVSLTPSLFSFPLLFVPFYLWRVKLVSRAGNDV